MQPAQDIAYIISRCSGLFPASTAMRLPGLHPSIFKPLAIEGTTFPNLSQLTLRVPIPRAIGPECIWKLLANDCANT